jgi:transposase-like protein
MQFTQTQIKDILSELVSKEDGLNTILKLTLEALMRVERTEHNEVHQDYSNGFRSRKAFGDKQMIELQVPRTRKGHFYPIILGLLKNQEAEARAISFSLYKNGLTTEQVGEVFEEIYGKHYSTSQVSRMFDTARTEVFEWLKRPLELYYPIVYIDATFIPTRRGDSVYKEAYYTLLGVRSDRSREVLGIYNFPTEGASQWEDVLADLKSRGVKEVHLFVSDSLSGVENAIWKLFPTSEIQLCIVHLQRSFLKLVRPKDKAFLAEDFRQVFRTDDPYDTKELIKARYLALVNYWSKTYPSFKNRLKSERMELYFTYIGFDYRIRNMIYTTNWIERLNRDFKRTTRMRGALPNPEATLLLLGGVAMTKTRYERKVPKLDYEQVKFKWDE